MSGVICPTYQSGFYSPVRGGLARYPKLWRRCVGAWAPCLGPTGVRLFDHSGYGRHGTLTNMDAASDWFVSGGSYALDFDSTDDRVTPGASGNFVESSTYWTVCCWFYARTSGEGGFGRLWNDGSTSRAFTNGANVEFYIGANQSIAAFTSARWTHIACVFRGSAKEIWLNGILMDSDAYSTATTLSVGSFNWGNTAATDRTFDGLLDDMRIYSVALTPAEVLLLSRRRGIAYERMIRAAKAPSVAPSTRRRQMLHCL